MSYFDLRKCPIPAGFAALRRESLDDGLRVPTDVRIGIALPDIQYMPISDGDEGDFVTGYAIGKVCDFVPMPFLRAVFDAASGAWPVVRFGIEVEKDRVQSVMIV